MPRQRRTSAPPIGLLVMAVLGVTLLLVLGLQWRWDSGGIQSSREWVWGSRPAPSGEESGGIFNIPILGDLARSLSNIFSTTPPNEPAVGIGAIIGYRSPSGETVTFTSWRSSGVVLTGLGTVNPMSGIAMKPDKPEYKALRLYDPDDMSEGEIWFQPLVSIAIYNGTPVSHNFTVTTRFMLQCDDQPANILEFNREVRAGLGGPPNRMEFSKSAVKGGKIFGELTSLMARGKGNKCQLLLVADYDGEIMFQGDEEPVKKSLSNVVLGRFELRRVTPAGDFEFSVVSNATVRPLAEVLVGGQGGVGRAVTYTQTRYVVTTQVVGGSTKTVTRTVVDTRTETVTVIVTVRQTITAAGGVAGGSVHPDTDVETPQGLVKIKDLQVGDAVYVFDPEGRRAVGRVLEKKIIPTDHYIYITLEDGTVLIVDKHQPIATVWPSKSWTRAEYITKGTIVATVDGGKRVIDIRVERGVNGTVIDLVLEPYRYYSANGVLVEDQYALKSGVLIRVPFNQFVFAPRGGLGWAP